MGRWFFLGVAFGGWVDSGDAGGTQGKEGCPRTLPFALATVELQAWPDFCQQGFPRLCKEERGQEAQISFIFTVSCLAFTRVPFCGPQLRGPGPAVLTRHPV